MSHAAQRKRTGPPRLTEKDTKPEFVLEVRSITEAADEESSLPDGVIMRVEAVLGQVDQVNRNGRIYPRKLIVRELKRLKPRLENREVFALCDHPGWTDSWSGSVGKIGGIQDSAFMEKDAKDVNVYGTIDLPDTVAGRDLAGILRAGASLGISSRGWGSTKEDEFILPDGSRVVARIVQDDYTLEGWDFVLGPSANASTQSFEESEEDPTMNTPAEITIDWLRENHSAVYDAALAIGVEQSGTDATAAVEAAQSEWNAEHATALAIKAKLDELGVEDGLSHVETADGRVTAAEAAKAAAESAKAAAESALAEATASASAVKDAISTIREKAKDNPAVFVECLDLAIGEDGTAQMQPAALSKVVESAISRRANPAPGSRPPRGNGSGPSEDEGIPTEEAAAEQAAFEKCNMQRRASGLPVFTIEKYREIAAA